MISPSPGNGTSGTFRVDASESAPWTDLDTIETLRHTKNELYSRNARDLSSSIEKAASRLGTVRLSTPEIAIGTDSGATKMPRSDGDESVKTGTTDHHEPINDHRKESVAVSQQATATDQTESASSVARKPNQPYVEDEPSIQGKQATLRRRGGNTLLDVQNMVAAATQNFPQSGPKRDDQSTPLADLLANEKGVNKRSLNFSTAAYLSEENQGLGNSLLASVKSDDDLLKKWSDDASGARAEARHRQSTRRNKTAFEARATLYPASNFLKWAASGDSSKRASNKVGTRLSHVSVDHEGARTAPRDVEVDDWRDNGSVSADEIRRENPRKEARRQPSFSPDKVSYYRKIGPEDVRWVTSTNKRNRKGPSILDWEEPVDRKIPAFKHSSSSPAEIHVPRIMPHRSYTEPSRDHRHSGLRESVTPHDSRSSSPEAYPAIPPPASTTRYHYTTPFGGVRLAPEDVLREPERHRHRSPSPLRRSEPEEDVRWAPRQRRDQD